MKLKLTRRRILIAAVAVVVMLFLWWHWPRGDARFVGTWETAPGYSFTFHANGTGSSNAGGEARVPWHWYVKGSTLSIRFDRPFANRVPEWLIVVIEKAVGRRLRSDVPIENYDVVAVEQDLLVVKSRLSNKKSKPFEWKRISLK